MLHSNSGNRRMQLESLVRQIIDQHDLGHEYSEPLGKLEEMTKFPDLEAFVLGSDWGPDQKAERLHLYRSMKPKLTREELVQLAEKIMEANGSEAEISEMVDVFDANCLHPEKNGLIFWPHGFPHNPDLPNPTAEEIVEKALSFKPSTDQ